jgi:hypothetical protein
MTLQQIKDLFTELESLEITELELRKGEKITNFKKFLDIPKATKTLFYQITTLI